MQQKKNSPLPPQRNNSPLGPFIVHLLLDLRTKANSTHDPIPEFLVQHRLIRVPIILHNLIQAVYQRLGRGHGPRAAAVGEACGLELRGEGRVVEVQELGERGDVGGGGGALAVEERGNGDFGAVQLLCNCFKGEPGRCLGVEEGFAGGWEVGEEVGLFSIVLSVFIFAGKAE